MANEINNANEYISGTRLFKKISNDNVKDFDIIGEEDSDEWLILHNFRKAWSSVVDNPNIYYNGKSGYDTLEYSGENITSVQLSTKDSDTIQIDGGNNPDIINSNGNNVEFDKVQVFATSVEQFYLTNRNDTVDLTGYAAAVSIFAEEGDDTIIVTEHDDVVDGGAGDDIISGKGGNDTIVATQGANTVYGGAGNDVIYTHSDMGDEDGVQTIYGDWEEQANGSVAQTDGTYNDADYFYITYDVTAEPVYADFTLDSNSEFTFDSAVQMGINQGLSMLPGGNIAAMGINMANMYLNPEVITGSAMVSAGGSTIEGKTVIGDFDVFADTAVVSMGAYGTLVNGDTPDATTGLKETIFTVANEEFFRLKLAEEQLSFMEFEDTDGVDNISGHADDIADNLLYNSLLIGRDAAGEIYVKSQYGVDYADDMSQAELDNFDAMLGTGEGDFGEEGVWLVGDYGDSVMYGQDKSLAGTNSNNIMYSGSYVAPEDSDSDPDMSEWFAAETVTMFGGLGNDVVFGGKADDDLYGNDGDDYINGMGNTTEALDHLYGGAGSDTASFEEVLDNDGKVIGGYTNHGTSHGVFVDLTQDVEGKDHVLAYAINSSKSGDVAWGSAVDFFDNGAVWNTDDITQSYYLGADMEIAALHDIENLTGTEADDVFVGDDQSNTLTGMDGNDYLDGGADDDILIGGEGTDVLKGGDGDDILIGGDGKDIMTGGAGADAFVFNGPDADGTKQWWERINDFDASEDEIHLDGTGADSFDDLKIVYNNDWGMNVTIINYGDGSIRLSGDLVDELTSDNVIFATGVSPTYIDRTSAEGMNLTDRMASADVSQSSDYNDVYVASEVIDGDNTTFNHTGAGDSDATLTFDLGQDQMLEGVNIVNRETNDWVQSRLEGAVVTVLDDGQVVWSSDDLTGDDTQYIDFHGVTGDTVEISNGSSYLHLGEVDIFTEFDEAEWDDLIEQMSNVTVEQSTNYSTTQYLASNAIDGDTSTFNHTGGNDSAPELTVDLNADAEIHFIDIVNREANDWVAGRLDGAVVEILDDGAVVWASAELSGNAEQLMYTGGVVGDEVRITHDAGNYLHIGEIDIYGDLLF